MTLRTKLILSFLFPAMLWLVVGFWSSSRVRTMGLNIEEFLTDNARSVHYAVEMLAALERMDSAILLKINGDQTSYESIMSSATVEYQKALGLASNNITLDGEREILQNLNDLSNRYFASLSSIGANPTLDTYHGQLFPIFTETRRLTTKLRSMNSDAMHQSALSVVERARGGSLPGDWMIVAGLVYAITFLYMVNRITPTRTRFDSHT